jgi:bacteriocin-like protein
MRGASSGSFQRGRVATLLEPSLNICDLDHITSRAGMFPREQRERGNHGMVRVTGETDAVVASGRIRRRRVMKGGLQKTECEELSDAELANVVGGTVADVGREIVHLAGLDKPFPPEKKTGIRDSFLFLKYGIE